MLNMGSSQFSFLFFLCFCQLSFCSSIPHICRKDQSSALLEFKRTLIVDTSLVTCSSYSYTSSWNMSIDCCSWDGVVCNEPTGHVIELNLSCSGLVGKIDSNSSLFLLSYLQRLDLSSNNFCNTNISPEFGRFSSLTYLDLSDSYFSGHIPSEISHLSKLQSLYFSGETLQFGPHDFEMLLQNLTQLRELHLTSINISSTIPPNFSSHLTTLSLGSTGLYGIIPESIFHLPRLETLVLQNNDQLSGYFPKTKWNSSASLVELDLSGVNFSCHLPESVGYLTSLHSLSLKKCNLRGPIPESLSNLTHILDMDLSDNSLNGTIPSGMFSLPSLNRLVLSNNHVSGMFEDSKSNSLTWIDLSNNQLQGHLPNSIQNLVNLTGLILSLNNLSGHVDVSFFADLKQLCYLDLSYNRIAFTNENKHNVTLPGSLMSLRLAACEVKELEFLRSAKLLWHLDLSNNKIEGKIPDWAWSNWMYSLKHLNLSHNMLESSLPIPPMSTRFFLISHNNLSGEIPSSICISTSLVMLDLAGNNLKGAIPLCLGNISALQVLDMHHNSLSGTLPTTFRTGSALKSFNFHGNKLEGKIPRSLINCQQLEVVDLGDNHLNDTFPVWLGAKVLSLRSNKLHGAIRTLTTENMFPQLQILDLSSNAFTKNIPPGLFQHLKAMRTVHQTLNTPSDEGSRYYQDTVAFVTKGLKFEVVRILFLYTNVDLSNNKFEGYIPSIMGDLIALRVLNISHNRLQGHIPPSLGSLSLVESLDLSSNHLVGEIPARFSSLTSLEVLNLSYNHLEGCIPQGNQFHTFENNSYEGNDGLRGFPFTRSCGDDRVSGTNHAVSGQLDDEESNSEFLCHFWKAALMGYGSGLCIGLSITYFMISTGNLKWLVRIIEELEHKIMMARRKQRPFVLLLLLV
ncbi:receptor-like protein Cf-9 [Solanum lycopersicum]|uniref:receptor-like protein Cf-9 n=1 Tax=Solanum lycopersicum TaxID=4081 RepID=UPI0037494085